MAAFRCADFISPLTLLPSYSAGRRVTLKVIRCSSSISIPLSSKSSRRKNYLRPKILRTLNPKPEETVLIGIESTENVSPIDVFSSQDDVVEELQVSSSSVVANNMNGIVSKLSPKLVAKYGFFFIGIFAFQTVCAVLFLGDSTKSEETLGISNDIGDSSSSSSSNSSVSSVVLLEDLEMNEKIAEIRVMAREARKSEEKSSKKEEDETSNPGGGIDIEKEIEARLSSMEKRLNSQRKGLAGIRVIDDLKDEKSLMFEKKYKFKAEKPPTGNVKGFGGTVQADKGKIGNNGNISEFENGEKNPEERQNEAGHEHPSSGAAHESEQRRPNMEAGSGFGKTLLSGKHGKVRKEKPMTRVREKQSREENKMWWLKLPYVLRILMRSNIGGEITEGYFTIRIKSMEENEVQVSHIIAFEDQNDARNLSYLLESVFEDLDDFDANVVPISTKDLLNEVSFDGKNVIVVKKSQLKMYAGQPFEDVERALHALIQEQR